MVFYGHPTKNRGDVVARETFAASLQQMLREILEILATAASRDAIPPARLALVRQHLQRIDQPEYTAVIQRRPVQSLPVCRYLQGLLDVAEPRLGGALGQLLLGLCWVQNPNYTAGQMPRGFLENYGYSELIGGRGLVQDEAFALGLLLLGPHTLYPPHHHPADEIYYTVAGQATWWQRDGPWIARYDGSLVDHPSGVVHAMRTADTPVLLLYCWWGEVGVAARLID
jgi:quercetin dioxygenase-like cupin family protein